MAAKKTSIAVNVTGDARDAIKAINQVTGELFKMQSKASAVGSALGSLAAKGVGAVVDMVRDYAGAVMDMSDSTQKFEQTMSFAGLDTSAIEQATKATRDYADSTVYDLTTIQNTTAQLAANGIKDYTGLTEAAGNLNAVAGGNADTFKSVAMVLTQTAGAGKLTTENWNQLADAIPGASGKLQEAMLKNGAYTGNFREAMEKGEISADEFSQAIMQLGMSDVAQEAATSTATMEGALGNLEAAITGGLTDAFDTIKPMVTDALGGAADTISEFAKTATDNLTAFMDGLKNTNAFQAIRDAIDAVGRAIGSLGDAFGAVAETIAPGLQGLSDAGGIGQTVGGLFETAAGLVQAVADKLTQFGDWVSANAEPISMLLMTIGGGFAAFQVAGIIQAVSTALQGFNVAAQIAAVGQGILNAVMNANPIMLLVTAIGAVVGALIAFFTKTEEGRAIWQGFTDFIGGAVESIKTFFSNLGESIKGFMQDAGDFVTQKWEAVTTWFGELPGRITGFFQGIPDTFASLFQTARSNVENIWTSITDWFGNIWNGIVNGVQGIGEKLTKPFRDAYNGIKGVFDSIISAAQSAWDTITGIFSGIGDAIGGAWDAITGILPFNLLTAAAMQTIPTVTPYRVIDPDAQGRSSGLPYPRQFRRLLSTPSTSPSVTVVNNNYTITFSDLMPDKDKVGRELKRLIQDSERRR